MLLIGLGLVGFALAALFNPVAALAGFSAGSVVVGLLRDDGKPTQ